jgi:iron complex transport system ATP-binding protein
VSQTTGNAILVEDLVVEFGTYRAVDGVTLDVGPGQWLGLIGPNGAGKSTLLRALLGLISHRGRIEVDGHRLAELDRRQVARTIAFVPQSPERPPEMSVADYVLLGRTAHIPLLGTESRHDLEVATRVIERLDLADLVGRPLHTLSGGEMQRAVLARALAQETSVLLLDEPTSALDVGHQQQVLELVEELRHEHGLTVVSAMHDLTTAGQYADRLVLLSNGRCVASGPPSTVLTEHIIAEHYNASVRVLHDECGGTIVVPVRAHRRQDSPSTDSSDADA